jgi:adenylosuccinate lyase
VTATRLRDGAPIHSLGGVLDVQFKNAPANGAPSTSDDGLVWATPEGKRQTPMLAASGALRNMSMDLIRIANDLRLLAHRQEVDEPFEAEQVGSSAMAYKRNPMRCERATGLCRFVMSLSHNPLDTAATQWLERTLDDSANRRLTIPQAFLAIDAILILYQNTACGLAVYPHVIAKHLREELPFMATENILMAILNPAPRSRSRRSSRS